MRLNQMSPVTLAVLTLFLGALFCSFGLLFFANAKIRFKKQDSTAGVQSVLMGAAALVVGIFSVVYLWQ